MRVYGFGSTGRKAYIIDEIQHLSRDCLRMLLGFLESLPSHVIVIGTTTSSTWADEIDGLFFSRWRRFIFRKPIAKAVAEHLERIASEVDLPVPDGFNMLSYVQGKMRHTPMDGNNIRVELTGCRMRCSVSVVRRWRLEKGRSAKHEHRQPTLRPPRTPSNGRQA